MNPAQPEEKPAKKEPPQNDMPPVSPDEAPVSPTSSKIAETPVMPQNPAPKPEQEQASSPIHAQQLVAHDPEPIVPGAMIQTSAIPEPTPPTISEPDSPPRTHKWAEHANALLAGMRRSQ